jgi:aspartate/methionine/tyrosine aminotransferase
MIQISDNRIAADQLPSPEEPVYAVPEGNLVPVSDHLSRMLPIPASRMFILKNSLKSYRETYPGARVFDASQGDGGASLPGTPREILERAAQLQIQQGTAYIMPAGTDSFRRAVVEQYWKIQSGLGIGPQNVLAASGGRDALNKAYEAALHLGHGRAGDAIIVSRVPWLCYNWGPYMLGANVILAPGREDEGWAYSEESIIESVEFAARLGRKVAAIIITSPDNPTGLTQSPDRQAVLAKTALKAGVRFVIFDWMYHYVTDESPMDLNTFLPLFEPEERDRLMFIDGLTKSLGGSNIRNAHLIASKQVVDFNAARMSHMSVPTFYSMAVAMAAYEMGYENATRSIIEPTNKSRILLKAFFERTDMQYIIGKGYYAFVNVRRWMKRCGWNDSEQVAAYLGENFGLAVVPGSFFSPFGRDWVRFSYATPPVYTLQAAERLLEGLYSLAS